MLLLLLQPVPSATFLPVWAQVVLLVLVVVALFFQWRHSLALKEFSIVNTRLAEVREENKKLLTENAVYKARTDLQPIIELLSTIVASDEKWKVEARGHYMTAMQRLEAIRAENIEAMKTGQAVLASIADKLKQ